MSSVTSPLPSSRPAVPAAASNLHAANPGGYLAQPSGSEALNGVQVRALSAVPAGAPWIRVPAEYSPSA